MITPNLHGRALADTLNEEPYLSLRFYSHGMTLRKRDGDAVTEYPVSPEQAASALATKLTFTTGLLSADTLYVWQEGGTQVVAEYRKPQLTGVFLEGSENAVRVPLPGMVLIRVTHHQQRPDYKLYAVKRRPKTRDSQLYRAPLPNVFTNGSICWGTVQRVDGDALSGMSLAAGWRQLLGSPFGSHAISGKSRACPQDVREHLRGLHRAGKKRYPTSDLVAASGRYLSDSLTLSTALEAVQ